MGHLPYTSYLIVTRYKFIRPLHFWRRFWLLVVSCEKSETGERFDTRVALKHREYKENYRADVLSGLIASVNSGQLGVGIATNKPWGLDIRFAQHDWD